MVNLITGDFSPAAMSLSLSAFNTEAASSQQPDHDPLK